MAPVICLTGNETTVAALAQRIRAPAADVALHEVRADHLDTIDDALFELVREQGHRILFCCRARAQGGHFDGTEAERLTLLRRAAAARWVDVEHDLPLDGFDNQKVVLSWHDFVSPIRMVEMARALDAQRPAVVKLAARVHDVSELAMLVEARNAIRGDAVVIGMGAAGLLSRVRYAALRSSWTYVASSAAQATAPGQLDLAGARAMGLPDTASAPFCALVGGEQIYASPGARVYNAIYRAQGLALSYVPIVASSLAGCLPVLQQLGARGLSATMPLKTEALALCTPDELAREVGSVNSLRLGASGWEGTNTDVEGVRAPLAALGVHGTALILGAGGAARAAAHACRALGLTVIMSARRELENVAPWERRADVAHDVLINATPIAGADSPWPNDAPLARWVFDLAIAERSALLERARREGSTPLDARRMWIHQGAQQMSWMLGVTIAPEQLEEHL